ncbi:MAG: ABC transporter substrate-binding protein [Gammaproteobacteria bacterium]|nr:ABC transporter substrate-binding protein [Gammaproteobacteria bacterium]MDH3508868.1 ABC transporter substrate-binding protein [Gammaproteobacteria bacterium]
MSNLRLSVAMGNYDRMRPIIDGRVPIQGVDPLVMLQEPEELFFRAFRNVDYDVCELSLSSFVVRTARGDCPYVGVPVFPSRFFRHTSIYIRTDRGIDKPEDLKGRRIGTPEYQLTACVWARALLADDYGVQPADITWVRGGIEEKGRVEKISMNLPADVMIEDIDPDTTLNELLAAGEIDGMVTPRAPSCFKRGAENVGRLFEDSEAAAREYFARTGIYPIMHLLGIRKALLEQHPWLAGNIVKAFEAAKDLAAADLVDIAAPKVMLPFLAEHLEALQAMMGEDIWPYGLEKNRAVLETFLRHHHAQGLSERLVSVEELFHPASLDSFRI